MAFRSSQYTSLVGSSSGTATMPAGIAVGDVLFAVIEVDNSALGAVTPPTNWSQIDILQPALPDGMTCILYQRIADGNESSQRTWTGLSATLNQGIIVAAWSGRNTSSPRTFLQPTSNTSANSSPVNVALAGGTAASNDDIAWFACGDSNGTTGWVWAAPASYQLRENQDQQWVPQGLATRDGVSGGATGTLTGTLTNSGNTAGFSGWVIGIAVTAGGPSITSNPSAQQVASGATASFSVSATASGGGTLSYQWQLNGSNVSTGSGGTTTAYTTAALAYSDDGGLYSCVVTETGGSSPGSTTSSSATLTVGTLVVGANTPVYSTSGGASVSPSYSTLPAISAGDEIVLIVAQKPSAANGGTVTTPGGYTLQGSLTGAGGYGSTLGNNTGNTNLFVYTTTATGSESGALSVTVGTNGICSAMFVLLRPITGSTISYGFASGSDTTAGNVSITCGSDPGETAGDIALQVFNGSSQLILPFSAQAITTTGITYGSVSELVEYGTTLGNDVAGYVASAKAQSGTSSDVPVFTATVGGTTTNARGPGVVLRMRATGVSPTPPSTAVTPALFFAHNF